MEINRKLPDKVLRTNLYKNAAATAKLDKGIKEFGNETTNLAIADITNAAGEKGKLYSPSKIDWGGKF